MESFEAPTKYIPKSLNFDRISSAEMVQRSRNFYHTLKKRRSVRDFASDPIPKEVIENCLLAAGTAPNGANRQPWHFVVVQNPDVKKDIRIAAEEEERSFYHHRAPEEWKQAICHLGTDENKPFLERAPALIAVFGRPFEGEQRKNYYVTESVGIATGMLITALHVSGLATLTHTPSPMRFLNKILQRPKEEKPFLLLVVGKPEIGCVVPEIQKKSLEEIATFI